MINEALKKYSWLFFSYTIFSILNHLFFLFEIHIQAAAETSPTFETVSCVNFSQLVMIAPTDVNLVNW